MASTAKKRKAPPSPGMWHKPQQLQRLANGLLFFSVLVFGYVGLMFVMQRVTLFPMETLTVTTPLRQVTPAQVEYATLDSVSGNFFTVSPERVRQAFEKLPWVREAKVRRTWPGGLEVSLDEQEAIAQWRPGGGDESMLMNGRGELFAAASYQKLPVLSGPLGRESDVLARYRDFSDIVRPHGFNISVINLSSRDAWSLRLESPERQLTLELGREQNNAPLLDRLTRFMDAYPVIKDQFPAPLVGADLRYPNGFAVRLGATETHAHDTTKKRGRK